MTAINTFLLENGLRIAGNPCVSPDFCLDWPSLSARLRSGDGLTRHPKSRVSIAAGASSSSPSDRRPRLDAGARWRRWPGGARGRRGPGRGTHGLSRHLANLLRLKNLMQEHDPARRSFRPRPATLGHSIARHRRALHHAALAGGRVGDERARASA